MKELREYQIDISHKASNILNDLKIVYLAMEVRTGKTATALNVCKLNGFKNVLFLTKKKAIQSIQEDYNDFGFDEHFDLTVINNESMHKINGSFDCVIHDESHRFGSFPKPSQGAKLFKQFYSHLPLILLSGTPTPESFSQIYHQFWVSDRSPFHHANFYKWANEFVHVTQRNLGYGLVNDYSKADERMIMNLLDKYMISFTQQESGFTSNVEENILYCEMSEGLYNLAEQLKKDLVIVGQREEILGDTAVKLMSKLHQMYSGTVKFESGNTQVLDYSKAIFIKEKFKGKKIGIFYKFKAEFEAIKEVYGDSLTNDLDEFNNTDKSIALQIVSGREGISLKNAECLVYYNLDFSATSYWQSRDRLTTMDRLNNNIYFVFTKRGLEDNIFKALTKKKSYTSNHFKKDFNVKFPKKDNRAIQA
jgi:hypothetical protein